VFTIFKQYVVASLLHLRRIFKEFYVGNFFLHITCFLGNGISSNIMMLSLNECSSDIYPTVKQLFITIYALPVSVASAERRFLYALRPRS